MDDADQTKTQSLEPQDSDRPGSDRLSHLEADANPDASTEAYFLCPFCGGATRPQARCEQCKGFLDPLSRQATQNVMGPWFIRDMDRPFRPGCNFETLAQLISRGQVDMRSILRGPTTNQFWMPARRTPGVANLLGLCHACTAPASPEMAACSACKAEFPKLGDRQVLGLLPVRPLPGQSSPDAVAASLSPKADPTSTPTSSSQRAGASASASHDSSERRAAEQMAARLEAVVHQSRVLGVWLAVSLVLVFAGGALVLAGFASGVLVWSAERPAGAPSGASPEVQPQIPAKAPERGATDAPPTPPKTDPTDSPAATGDGKPVVDSPAEPVAPARDPAASNNSEAIDPVIAQARDLIKAGTKESLTKAVELLEREESRAAGDRLSKIKLELRAAKALRTAAELKGSR